MSEKQKKNETRLEDVLTLSNWVHEDYNVDIYR